MLNVSGTTRVFLAVQPVDLRGSFNRLHSLVIEALQEDPISGHVFLFVNKRRNRVKALFWDGSGLWVCAKRLERNRFQWPHHDGPSLRLRGEEFAALINGLEVRKRPGWYRR